MLISKVLTQSIPTCIALKENVDFIPAQKRSVQVIKEIQK